MSSLLRTKNTKLLKRLLQRTNDWQISVQQEDSNPNKRKKRKLQQMEQTEAKTPQSEEEIIDRHIKTLLSVDKTLASKPRDGKKSNMQVSLQRVEQDKGLERHRRLNAKTNSMTRGDRVRTGPPTSGSWFNKNEYTKQQKQRSIDKIAKLLQSQKQSKSRRKKQKSKS